MGTGFGRKAASWAVCAAVLAVLAGALGLIARRQFEAAGRSGPTLNALGQASRGRRAAGPSGIPLRGWRDILARAWNAFQEDNITLVAAGVTFYALLAFFPGLAAFVALYGLFADVADARDQLQHLAFLLPRDTVRLLGEQMIRVAPAHTGGLSLGARGARMADTVGARQR